MRARGGQIIFTLNNANEKEVSQSALDMREKVKEVNQSNNGHHEPLTASFGAISYPTAKYHKRGPGGYDQSKIEEALHQIFLEAEEAMLSLKDNSVVAGKYYTTLRDGVAMARIGEGPIRIDERAELAGELDPQRTIHDLGVIQGQSAEEDVMIE
jgi:GGDEF domain-containing protein